METDTGFTSFIVIKTASGWFVSMSVSLLTTAVNSSSIGQNSKLRQISYMHARTCYERHTVIYARYRKRTSAVAAKHRRRCNQGETRLIDTLISSNCGIIARHFLSTFLPAPSHPCSSFHPLSHL